MTKFSFEMKELIGYRYIEGRIKVKVTELKDRKVFCN